jgi:hypothetical protein
VHRRYTIHRDGDLLVEELDASGKPIDPEPVAPEDRLPIEVVVLAADDADSKAALVDLLELAHELESNPEEKKPRTGHKLNVIS